MDLETLGSGAGFLLAATTLTGCAAVKGIFEAGVWFGILGVVAVLFLSVTTLGFLKR